MGIIPYSASKVDLLYPARSGNFFPAGMPKSEAALCAEMARLAYYRQDPYFQFDREKIRSVLKPFGFDCLFFESKGTPDGRGTHGFLASSDNWEEGKSLAIVVFRGTDASDPTDLAADVECLQIKWRGLGRVHKGFAEELEHVLPDLELALEGVKGRMLFTGHSLGAAMATLLCGIKPPGSLYTFGSPRVGDVEFVRALQGVVPYRFVNCCDIVARMPPELSGTFSYIHFGGPHYINRRGEVATDLSDETFEKDRILAAGEYLAEYGWRTGNVSVRELADHAPINYVNAVACSSSIGHTI